MSAQTLGQWHWLVQTKLQPPLPRNDEIHRPDLLAALCQAVAARRLTLISAPAGYGKTTLLTELGQEGTPATSIAWLTLDKGDNDPVLFFAYIVASLQRLSPDCGATAQALLTASAASTDPATLARRAAGALVNDVLEALSAPFALVLDDLHLITEPTILLALDELLEHLPPQMHLVVGARHDPPFSLARLRARGQLAELRAPDLRFAQIETTILLNDVLGLNLSSEDIAHLQARTEGWPAGLRLLAASLERISTPTDRTTFIAHLAQTPRYIFDFLADEVLNRQPPDLRAFLLETAILPELTPALCTAVTGRADAAVLLENLHRRNLFITAIPTSQPADLPTTDPLLPNPPTYRYHTLFAEFLRQRLEREMPGQAVELHRRAAEAQQRPYQAMRHYLAAGMWEAAAETIEAVGEQMFNQGLLNTLSDWIRALPSELLDEHPLLTWFLGNGALLKGEFKASRPLLEQALQRFSAAEDAEKEGGALATLAASAFLDADFERAGALIHRALVYPVPRPILVQLLMVRSWLGLFGKDWARARADFEAALATTLESDDPLVWLMLAFSLKPDFAALPGGLEHIERFCRAAEVQAGGQAGPLQLVVEELATFTHLWRGRLDRAVQAGERALAIKAQLDGFPFLGGDAAAYLAVTHAARGDYDAADRCFDVLNEQIGQVALDRATEGVALYLLGRTRWLQGRLEEARRLYASMCAVESERESPVVPALRLMMRGLLELAAHATSPGSSRRYADAERFLHEGSILERQIPTVALVGSARLLLAHLYLAWDRPDDALAELKPILAECERQNTPGYVLKEGAAVVPVLRLAVERGTRAAYAAHLLDLLGAGDEPRPLPIPETGETLTPREAEVLHLIAAGASNRAIAERLVVTERTVKAHVSSILRKLDVSSRTQAAARARELRIV